MRSRRFFRATDIGVVLLLAVGLAASVVAESSASAWKRVESDGITLRVPATWAVMRYGPWCMRGEGGVLATSVARAWHHLSVPDGCTTMWSLPRIPASFRGVDVERFAFPFGSQPNTKLPLQLPFPRVSSHPARGETIVWHNAAGYVVTAFWGQHVRKHDPVLATVIRSIRFTH